MKNQMTNKINNFINDLKNSKSLTKYFIPIAGLISLIWFLIRIIPKPSRAAYPCQRIAFPIASTFIIWITGVITSLILIIKSYKFLINIFMFSIIALFIIFCLKNDNSISTLKNNNNLSVLNNEAGVTKNEMKGNPDELVKVGFVSSENEPSDMEIKNMVDEVVIQTLGEKGLSAIIKPGYKVIIKVNMVGPHRGTKGEQGRGIITDTRIVRYVAEKVRDIIGFDNPADIKVIDGLFYEDKNPSLKSKETSFYYARLERTEDNKVSKDDICYDFDGDGILDGSSKAELVNCDAIGLEGRYCTIFDEPILGKTKIYLPKFLRTNEQANGEDEYCDVFIGLPVFKSHSFTGITGAIKLNYGLRHYQPTAWDSGRAYHSGYGWGTGNKHLLVDYLIAQQKTRKYDLVIMDCLTGNRVGPLNTSLEIINAPTDYILTNSLLCAVDPVAIDTVESIFAGYDPASIMLLNEAAIQGLGTNNPELINIKGYDNFYKQKMFLYNKYHVNNIKDYNYRSYPFQNGWGGTALLNDFTAPVILSLDDPVLKGNNVYTFKFSADDKNKNDSGIARIDLLINGKMIKYKIDKPKENFIEIVLKDYINKTIVYQIAVWDKALNCTLSEEKKYDVR